MTALDEAIDPGEWFGRLQRSYLATADEAVLDELTDIGRLLAVTGIPVECVIETHGDVLADELSKAWPPAHPGLVQAAAICLSEVVVAWRVAAEGINDGAEILPPEATRPPVFMRFDRAGGLVGGGASTTLAQALVALGMDGRMGEVAEAIRQRRLMIFEVSQEEQSEQMLRAVVCPFRDGSGLLCIHDVTARRAAAEALFQSRKLASLGQLASGIAHELNNLLQPILITSQFICEDYGDNAALMAEARIILESARAAADVVSDVLAFARRGVAVLEPMPLVEVVEREVAVIRRSLTSLVSVVVHAGDPAVVVLANSSELAQILRNLIGNAVDAMHGVGTVTVSVDCEEVGDAHAMRQVLPAGRYARLSVADDGPGLDTKTAPRIFEPFFTTKGIGKGTGLGLAIVRGIVQAWNGVIVPRKAIDRGLVFDIFLPLTDASVSMRTDAMPALAAGDGARVVVVEDDARVAATIVRTLDRAGYAVRHFPLPEEALRHFGDEPVDVVVSDWLTAGMDTFAFIKEMRRRYGDIPVLVLTGGGGGSDMTEDGVDRWAAELGVGEVLIKPVPASALLAALQQCLKGRPTTGRDETMPSERQMEIDR